LKFATTAGALQVVNQKASFNLENDPNCFHMNRILDCKLTDRNLKTGTLETLIRSSHNIRIFGRIYHPYHLAQDLGTITLLIFSVWWIRDRSQLSVLAFVGAFLSMPAVYLIA
jgi:hypothetical protein